MLRLVAPETLDVLSPQDPDAIHSRGDLVKVDRMMRTRSITAQAWQALVAPERGRAPLKILELGAGDGTLLLGVAGLLAPRWPPVQLTLLDQVDIVSPSTRAAYAALGWTLRVQVSDALEWVAGNADAPHWDLVSTALFLHHFEVGPLGRLLAAVAARSDGFFAFEPARSWIALAGSHLLGVLGANAVTRKDAVLSVRAGFRPGDIAAAWPRRERAWRLKEAPAGPFGHSFLAQRMAVCG